VIFLRFMRFFEIYGIFLRFFGIFGIFSKSIRDFFEWFTAR